MSIKVEVTSTIDGIVYHRTEATFSDYLEQMFSKRLLSAMAVHQLAERILEENNKEAKKEGETK